jgi:hypothetical protein
MQKLLLLTLSSFVLITVASSQQHYEKLSQEQIDPTDIRLATSLAEKLLLGQKNGNIYLFKEDEAIKAVVDGLTEEMQASSYATMRDMFGDYESMEFAEGWRINSEPNYLLFRFKGTFSESTENPEIRVVLNLERKLAGFYIRPWQDDLIGQP